MAERTTGRVLSTTPTSSRMATIATFEVDASGDGGLIDFARSPNYDQDQLLYAYITTPTDNRIVRLAPGDVPKPILTGIPKGANGNLGSMRFNGEQLVVATGNAGNPSLANDPNSLAGKLLVLPSLNSTGNNRPKVAATGLGAAPAICPDITTSKLYLTDQGPGEDRLQEVSLSTGAVPKLLWSWPDRPGVAGCAAIDGSVMVSETRTQRIELLQPPTENRPTMAAPIVVLEKKFGALGRMAVSGTTKTFVVATVNKQYAKPGKTDDRVFTLQMPPPDSKD